MNALSPVILLAFIIVVLAFAAFLLNACLPSPYKRQGALLSCVFLLGASITSIFVTINSLSVSHHFSVRWFEVGDHTLNMGVYVDFQSACMLLIVSLVSFLVHVYSTVYMREDAGYKRYFSFLGLFTFAMYGIVVADNLLGIFIFWELVGLCSYLLIGHWYTKDSASKAAKKAFIVNRIGDAGFVVALAVVWAQFKTFDLTTLLTFATESSLDGESWVTSAGLLPVPGLHVLSIGIFLAAVGKSAQFPLQVWLPDAMEGPTPVSALIHAATMVAAGVYLMSRVFVLLTQEVLLIIALVGSVTAFMGAVAALYQRDIKKVLAYSTISQLGYMIMGIGVHAPEAAMFHLFTHAFFKAALFLAAGAVIHALHEHFHKNNLDHDAQDMFNMGGLRRSLPVTFAVYLVATLALMGLPLFSGFLSKDALLSAAVDWSLVHYSFIIPILAFSTVALTAFYMARQIFLVFFGQPRFYNSSDVEEPGKRMLVALVVLGALSLGVFWSLNPFDFNSSWVLNRLTGMFDSGYGMEFVIPPSGLHLEISIVAIVLVAAGIGLAWVRFKKGYSEKTTGLLAGISLNNWYLDKLYSVAIVRPLIKSSKWMAALEKRVIDRLVDLFGWFNVILSFIIAWIDRAVVDGFVNISVFFAGRLGGIVRTFQIGKAQSFVLLAIFGVLLMIFLIL